MTLRESEDFSSELCMIQKKSKSFMRPILRQRPLTMREIEKVKAVTWHFYILSVGKSEFVLHVQNAHVCV